jgi:hypothetical protein
MEDGTDYINEIGLEGTTEFESILNIDDVSSLIYLLIIYVLLHFWSGFASFQALVFDRVLSIKHI